MSGMRHPTISAWLRQEDGGYAAEINGWLLRVVWHPEPSVTSEAQSPGPIPRGFSWVAERAGERQRSQEIFEELEVAMGAAEALLPDA
jgi:hypothetical protein